MKSRLDLSTAFFIVCFAILCGLLGYLRPFIIEQWERTFFDIHYASLPTPPEQEQVVVVLAGEKSFEQLGAWPWSRAYHAHLLGRLGHAKAILLDVIMPETGDPKDDQLLAAVVKTMGNVAVAGHIAPGPTNQQQVILPHDSLAAAAAQIGITNVDMDVDGYLRFITPVWDVDDSTLASFPLAGVLLTEKEAPGFSKTLNGYTLELGNRHIPLDLQGRMWVQTSTKPIKRYEYWDVLNGEVPAEAFAGKYVVVGIAASGAADFHLVPSGLGAVEMPGAEFNAKALASMLWGVIPVRILPLFSGLVAAIMGTVGGLVGGRRPLTAFSGVLIAAVLYALGVHALFVQQGVWIETALPLLSLACSFLAVQALRYVYLHRDWEIQSESLNQITDLDAGVVSQFDEFAKFMEYIWPTLTVDKGISLLKAGVPRESIDARFLPEDRRAWKVVKPGPEEFKWGLALEVPLHGDREHFVLLGWKKHIDPEIVRVLVAGIMSHAWFFKSVKDAQERKQILFRTIRSIFTALDYRDPVTGGHSNRVSTLVLELMQHMNLQHQQMIDDIYLGAMVHDVGKIGIPDSVLLKADKLTDEEFAAIKAHPEIGANIMDLVGLPDDTMNTIAQHHERYDGSGYPLRLSGNTISLGGRITAVADVFDALTSDRPYRKGCSLESACKYIYAKRGNHFDPEVVIALMELKLGAGWKKVVLHDDQDEYSKESV